MSRPIHTRRLVKLAVNGTI